MNCRHRAVELLPFYARGTLTAEERQVVNAHLSSCAACRAELALWQEVGVVVSSADAALPEPSPAVLAGALARLRGERPGLLARVWQLLSAQVPLVRAEIWSASALIIALGFVVTVAGANGGRFFGLLGAVAPLVAAAGVSLVYGPENDPALELALATPTSPRQVLLARLSLVFGWDLALSLVASLGLASVIPVELLGGVILGWLGPMAFLSALALTLSLRIGAGGAVAAVSVLWLGRWLGQGLTLGANGQAEPLWQWATLAQLYANAWANSALLLGLAALLLAAALWLVGRGEASLAGDGLAA